MITRLNTALSRVPWLRVILVAPRYANEEANRRATILYYLLLAVLAANVVAFTVNLITFGADTFASFDRFSPLLSALLFVVLIIAVRSAFWRPAAIVFLVATFLQAVAFVVATGGLAGNLTVAWGFLLVLAGLVLGTQGILLTVVMQLAAVLLLSALSGLITPAPLDNTTALISIIFSLLLIAGAVYLGNNITESAFKRLGFANTELAEERESLADRVAKRTRLLRVSAEVAQVASQILDPDDLVREVAQLIGDRFGYYYVAIFLLDETGQWAVLRSATGEAGATLLDRNHRLPVGGQSMVGAAISRREARIALDVGAEAVRFNNPLLPNTRSELALPLIARGELVGAIDVQSLTEAAFGQEDLETLQTLANQLATALENARLYQQAQQSLEEVQRITRVYLQEAWSTTQERMAHVTYQVDAEGDVQPIERANLPGLAQAINQRQPIVIDHALGSAVTVPLVLRGEVIGALSLQAPDDREWSDDELAIIQAVSNQAALAMENARLIQESQAALAETRRLAERERQLNQIATRIRLAIDLESVLQTTAEEIHNALGIERTLIRIGGTDHLLTEDRPTRSLPSGNGAAGSPDSRGQQ